MDLTAIHGDMFVRIATRRNKDGSAVRYVQLVQNEWDPAAKSSRMRVVHSFGREDQLDRAAVERLAGSLGRLLGQGQPTARTAPELAYAGSVAFGGTYLLDQLWRRLGIGQVMTAMLGTTRRGAVTERVLFALVANRALDPSSKLAAAHWVGRTAWIDGLPGTTDDACYRAMDWLHQVKDAVEQEIFGQVANLLKPRGGPAVLPHHQHLLRGGGERRTGAAGQDQARRRAGTGAVRPGRQPGAGPVFQARRRALGGRQGLDRRAAPDH